MSLRNFGGALAGAGLRACFVEPGNVESSLLAAFGVEVRMVPAYPGVAAPTNKLRMFEAFAAAPEAQCLLALDCDVVVVGDLSADVSAEAVRLVPAVVTPLTPAGWTELLTDLDLPVGQRTTTMQSGGSVVPAPYYNSGVMNVPATVAAPLVEAWRHYVDLLEVRAADAGRDGAPVRWLWHVDQVALTCALLATGIEVEPLDVAVNLTTGLSWRNVEHRFATQPLRLLHYHRRLTASGQLLPTDSPVVNEVLDEVNRLLAVRSGRKPENRAAARLRLLLSGREPGDLRQVASTPDR